MKKRVKKKRVNVFRLLRTCLILVVIVALGYGLLKNSIFSHDRTYHLEYGKLNIEDSYRSIILRKEFIVGTLSTGPVKYHVSEGQLVKNGERVLTISHQSGTLRPKVLNAPTPITGAAQNPTGSQGTTVPQGSATQGTAVTTQSATTTEFAIDPAALKRDIENIEKKIAQAVRSNDLGVVTSLKKEMALKLDKLDKIKKSKEREAFGETSYHEIYFGGEHYVPGQSIDFTSPIPGLMTFNVDGLEKALTVEQIYDIDYEKLIETGMTPRNLSGDKLNAGNPVFKVVDNSVWYIVSLVDKSEMDLFEKNKDVSVMIGSETLKGSVIDVFESSQDKGAVLVKLNEYYKDFYKVRFVDAKIVRKNFQGLKLFKDSLVSKDGVEGVFVKDINGKPSFVPVKLLGQNEEFAIAKSGFINIEKENKLYRVKSLDLDQQVLRNGAKYLTQ